MDCENFTTIHSLLEALARAMNLVNPEEKSLADNVSTLLSISQEEPVLNQMDRIRFTVKARRGASNTAGNRYFALVRQEEGA